MFYILSQKNCSYCTKAKELIISKGYLYEETNIKSNPILKALAIKANLTTVPQIWVSTFSTLHYIGGYAELCQHFGVPTE